MRGVSPARQQEAIAKGRAAGAVHRARVSVVGLEVLLVVAHGALVDEPVLRAGEVDVAVPGWEIERETACLARDDTFCTPCSMARRRISLSWAMMRVPAVAHVAVGREITREPNRQNMS